MKVSSKYALVAPIAACLALAVGACGSSDSSSSNPPPSTSGQVGSATGSSLPQGSEHVTLDPAQFTTKIDNPYFPLSPGSRWVYREVENGVTQRVVVTVTNRTKVVDGITAQVIHDVVSAGDQPVEKTWDWYAQDSAGNVWYLGEDTKEYTNGKVSSTAGSWEAGVGGAEAGVIMPAQPEVGSAYRQEYDKGNAEDKASVVDVNARAKVPFGGFNHVLHTRDVNPLEKNFVEQKFFAKGVGPVETIQVSGGTAHEVLLSYHQ